MSHERVVAMQALEAAVLEAYSLDCQVKALEAQHEAARNKVRDLLAQLDTPEYVSVRTGVEAVLVKQEVLKWDLQKLRDLCPVEQFEQYAPRKPHAARLRKALESEKHLEAACTKQPRTNLVITRKGNDSDL